MPIDVSPPPGATYENIMRQKVLNAGIHWTDKRWTAALQMAKAGKESWQIAEWVGADPQIVLALGKPPSKTEVLT